jgi:hypothetical protein
VKEYVLKNLKRSGQEASDEVKVLLKEWFGITEFREHVDLKLQTEQDDSYLERRAQNKISRIEQSEINRKQDFLRKKKFDHFLYDYQKHDLIDLSFSETFFQFLFLKTK